MFVQHTRQQWQIVFYISAAMYLFGMAFYLVFATGKLQSWAIDDREESYNKSKPSITYSELTQSTSGLW